VAERTLFEQVLEEATSLVSEVADAHKEEMNLLIKDIIFLVLSIQSGEALNIPQGA
jgi:hypothetical protein